MRILLVLALIVVAFLAFKPSAFAELGVVRLSKQKQFFCSGFVVSEKTVITAAHCFGKSAVSGLNIQVAETEGATSVIARVVGLNEKMDVAVLQGNFSKMAKVKLATEAKEVMGIVFSKSAKLAACGFPLGGPMACVSIGQLHPHFFQFSSFGQVFPGMSGGVLINIETNTAIGVISAMLIDRILLSPTINIYAATQTKPE